TMSVHLFRMEDIMGNKKKTWIRRAIMTSAALVLIVLIVNFALLMYGRTSMENAVVDLERHFGSLEDLTLDNPEIPDSENAALMIMDGAKMVAWSEDDTAFRQSVSFKPYHQWTEEEIAGARTVLDRHKGALEVLHAAAPLEKSDYGIPYGRRPLDKLIETPDLLYLIRASRLLLIETRVACIDGDRHALLLALRIHSKLVTTLSEESLLITALVATACDRMLLYVTGEILAEARPPFATPDFFHEVSEILPDYDPIKLCQRCIITESIYAYQFKESTGGENKASADVKQEMLAMLHGDLKAAAYLEGMIKIVALAREPYGANPDLFNPNTVQPVIWETNVSGLFNAIFRFQIEAGQRQLVLAGLRLRQTGLEMGAYPATAPDMPELTTLDAFSGKGLTCQFLENGSLRLERAGAKEALQDIEVAKLLQTLTDVVLPPIN
ncbi:hypothetical protein ACFLU6_06640, partial [Acidobacteriota bacterium]